MKTLAKTVRSEIERVVQAAKRRNRRVWVTIASCPAMEASGLHAQTVIVEPAILDRPDSRLARLTSEQRAARRDQAKRVFDHLCERLGRDRVRLGIGGLQYRRLGTGALEVVR